MKITIKTIMIIMILSIVDCKPKEPKKPIDKKYAWAYRKGAYKHTVLPHVFLGVNFCKINFIKTVKKFQRKKIGFIYYNPRADREVKYSGEKIDFKSLELIRTNYCAFPKLDKSKVVEVIYSGSYYVNGWIQIKIKFKEDYYYTLLDLLGKKLGTKTVNYNRKKYNETAWNTDPDHAVPTCISKVLISRRLRYDDIKKENDGFAYLQIDTRPPKEHVP